MNEPTLKLCKDCKYCLPSDMADKKYYYAKCARTTKHTFSLVSGAEETVPPLFCSTERSDAVLDTSCGPSAKFFEPLSPVSPKLLATPETGLSGSATAGD